MYRSEYYSLLKQKYPDILVFSDVLRTCDKISEHFQSHDCIGISVSGGSDSDCIVHLVCTYFPELLYKCKFVFVNTGLEYDATKRHICELEKQYNIAVDRIRGQSVVTVIRKYGVPILSKEKSELIEAYCRDVPWAVKRLSRTGSRYGFTPEQILLAEYIKKNGIKISKKCCDYSKKKPLYKYFAENGIDLNVTGERKAEGGQRASKHKSCFEQHYKKIDKFMPLWWWSNSTKAAFKSAEGIRYSDCYEIWGLRRTGCVGCPYNIDIAKTIQAMHEYEPNLYKACMNVFGLAYELTDKFNCRRKKCIQDIQLTLF